MTEDELRGKLEAFVASKRFKAEAARDIGISRPYLLQIMNGQRSISCPAILNHFGYTKAHKIKKFT